ncbi:hypothetical protein D3228_12040 [Leucobacter luti]|nr:hypothetical protein [Leucobacter luti]
MREAVPALTDEKLTAIVGFSTAFAGALTQMVDQEHFLDSVANRAKDDLPSDKSENLKSRLKALFQAPSIAFIGGGKAALRDNLKMVVRSQINTDMRPIPVFGNDEAKYFSVLHRLKFDYSDEIGAEPDKNVELVLDFEDLKELRDRIQKALDAQSSIQRAAASLGGAVYFPYTIEGDGDE